MANRRVIYKKGLIRRQTNEMNMDKVERRMLDYGDLAILGTGEGLEALRTIASPIGSFETASPERRTKRDACSDAAAASWSFVVAHCIIQPPPTDRPARARRHRHRLQHAQEHVDVGGAEQAEAGGEPELLDPDPPGHPEPRDRAVRPPGAALGVGKRRPEPLCVGKPAWS